MIIKKPINKLAAILLGKAIKDLYPEITLAEWSLLDEGFAYTAKFELKNPSTHDFNKIIKYMQKNIDRNYQVKFEKVTKKVAKDFFHGNEFKTHWIDTIKDDHVILCSLNNEYYDICDEVINDCKLSSIKAIDLLNVSGSYWKGDASNVQLVSISGIAFDDQKEIQKYRDILKERNERDHRNIGNELELFTFNQLVGQGMPIWLPNGAAIKWQMENYMHELLDYYDYNFVSTPILGSVDLYKISGHWNHYRENMFPPIQLPEESLVLRPMNCPHHLLVYSSKQHSYRELPYRIAELANQYRYEASGGLTGLERVRSMQLVDTHIVLRHDQIASEVSRIYGIIKQALETFDINIYSVDLSLHDPNDHEKFFPDENMWKNAETQLRQALNSLNVNYKEMVGEAAFYGPKIDMQVKTVLGHVITVSTIQVDFLLPKKFHIEYVDIDGNKKIPAAIHAGIIGTFERFISILLEQTKGVLPLWLAPTQVQIILVNEEKHYGYANLVCRNLKRHNIRVKIDNSQERLAKKIRNAQVAKIPYQVIIGDDEVSKKQVSYRKYSKTDSQALSIEDFISVLENEIKHQKLIK